MKNSVTKYLQNDTASPDELTDDEGTRHEDDEGMMP
jgi:hypothetical protein